MRLIKKATVSYWVKEIAELRAEIDRIEQFSEDGINTSDLEAEESTAGPESEQADDQDELREAAEAFVNGAVWFEKCDGLEQAMIGCIETDATGLTAPSYLAALILAGRNRRPEVVLPYLGRWIEMFYEAKFPSECHELTREIFEAISK